MPIIFYNVSNLAGKLTEQQFNEKLQLICPDHPKADLALKEKMPEGIPAATSVVMPSRLDIELVKQLLGPDLSVEPLICGSLEELMMAITKHSLNNALRDLRGGKANVAN